MKHVVIDKNNLIAFNDKSIYIRVQQLIIETTISVYNSFTNKITIFKHYDTHSDDTWVRYKLDGNYLLLCTVHDTNKYDRTYIYKNLKLIKTLNESNHYK